MDNKNQRIKYSLEEKKQRMAEKMAAIPEINWKILRYANHHNKEQCLAEYPEHSDFINTVTFND